MNPATIAIIPLVLAEVGIFACWYRWIRKSGDDVGTSISLGFFLTLLSTLVCVLLWTFANVVYFNSWTF